ncbi:MAG: ABC transporter ATP-binding protein [Firmicutes bacterium]|nr:ABC transporter ATP-binding protein [Bacillota bacterium]
MLAINDLCVFYGRIQALHDVSLAVNQGEIVSIVGANGAGKSTLLWTIMGVNRPRKGGISFEGRPLRPIPDEVASKGIALVPERRRLFANLTVKENLLMGAYLRRRDEGMKEDLERAFTMFPVLKQRINQYAGTLSGGEQQMLAISRALMARPKLLLFDEPSLGLAPALTEEVFRSILEIRQRGTTVILAEQNAFKALEMADRAYVLETGRVTLTGTGAALLENPVVQAAYLGIKTAEGA